MFVDTFLRPVCLSLPISLSDTDSCVDPVGAVPTVDISMDNPLSLEDCTLF